jgi:hypothetical protein
MNRHLTALLSALICAAALIFLASPAHAGGWATVGITAKPEQIYAGQPFTVEFMVWQHGNKPVHNLVWDNNRRIPVTPRVRLSSADGQQKAAFEAVPAKKLGLFTAEITLPDDGEWHWSIMPDPLVGATKLEPLTALPAGAAPAAQSATPFTPLPVTAGVPLAAALGAVALLGVIALAAHLHRARQPA